MIPWPIYTFIFLELICVTYVDVKYKKISNLWSILNIGLAVVLFILFPDIYIFGIETFLFTIVIPLVGFLLFVLNIMGGGDSKFLATFFLIIPTATQDITFYFLLLSTIIVGIIFFLKNVVDQRTRIFNSIMSRDVEGIKLSFGTKFAFAPVILLTWFLIGLQKMEYL